MKIVLFANNVVDPVRSMTGIGRYVENLSRALAAVALSEFEYEIVGPPERGLPSWVPAGMTATAVRGPRKLLHLSWTATQRPRIERLVGAFDLFHALHPSYPVPTGRPAVITVHDVMPLEHPSWYSREERWGFRRTLEIAASHGWTAIAVSSHVAVQLKRHGLFDARDVVVIHEGIGEEFVRGVRRAAIEAVCGTYGIEPGRYVLALGSVSTRKNLETLVRAMGDVAPADVAHLVLAGKPHTSEQAVRSEVRRLGMEERVVMTGFVPSAQVPPLVAGAKALLHASVDEGFGMPPLEAMGCGTPVIAAAAGSLPEVVGGAGRLVDPTDASAWAAAIGELDGEHTRALVEAGRRRVDQFTWMAVARQTGAVHRRVLGV